MVHARPVGAIQRLLKQIEWRAEDVDLYEIKRGLRGGDDGGHEGLSLDHGKVM